MVEDGRGDRDAFDTDAAIDDFLQIGARNQMIVFQLEQILFLAAVDKTEVLRNDFVGDKPPQRTLRQPCAQLAVKHPLLADLDGGMQAEFAGVVRHNGFVDRREDLALANFIRYVQRQIVAAHDHILGGHGDRLAVLRLEQVVGRQHQKARLGLRFGRQRYVDGHLVAVKVGIVSRTDQRMQLNGPPFDQNRFKGLDAQAVQRRRTVEQHRMVFDYFFEDIPNDIVGALNQTARGFDVVGVLFLDNFLHDKRLEQLQRHLFGQTALVQFELRTNHDDRATGIVHALAQQVLTETALLAFEQIGQRFERAIAGTGDRAPTASVVDQGVDRFLQHAFFVADDDFRGSQLQELVHAVVAVDHASIQIIEIGRSKAPTVQLHHRTQVGRQDGQDVQHHPLRPVAGFFECFHDFQPLDDAGFLLPGGRAEFLAQFSRHLIDVDFGQQFFDRFGTHRCAERIAPAFFLLFTEFLIGEDLFFAQAGFFVIAGVKHNIGSKI